MASWKDVRRIALDLPETSERPSRGLASWRVRDKAFVWERPLREKEIRELGDAAPDGPILGAWVEDLGAKEALLADDSDLFREVIVEAWLAKAPKRLGATASRRA